MKILEFRERVTLTTKVVKRNEQALIDANEPLISSKGNLSTW